VDGALAAANCLLNAESADCGCVGYYEVLAMAAIEDLGDVVDGIAEEHDHMEDHMEDHDMEQEEEEGGDCSEECESEFIFGCMPHHCSLDPERGFDRCLTELTQHVGPLSFVCSPRCALTEFMDEARITCADMAVYDFGGAIANLENYTHADADAATDTDTTAMDSEDGEEQQMDQMDQMLSMFADIFSSIFDTHFDHMFDHHFNSTANGGGGGGGGGGGFGFELPSTHTNHTWGAWFNHTAFDSDYDPMVWMNETHHMAPPLSGSGSGSSLGNFGFWEGGEGEDGEGEGDEFGFDGATDEERLAEAAKQAVRDAAASCGCAGDDQTDQPEAGTEAGEAGEAAAVAAGEGLSLECKLACAAFESLGEEGSAAVDLHAATLCAVVGAAVAAALF